ncbi:MAG: hypothetical protein MZV70_67420 [Desulfobacterales bacterium]|nr:hypothetical protein [Desulfobacterales bacterium]
MNTKRPFTAEKEGSPGEIPQGDRAQELHRGASSVRLQKRMNRRCAISTARFRRKTAGSCASTSWTRR